MTGFAGAVDGLGTMDFAEADGLGGWVVLWRARLNDFVEALGESWFQEGVGFAAKKRW